MRRLKLLLEIINKENLSAKMTLKNQSEILNMMGELYMLRKDVKNGLYCFENSLAKFWDVKGGFNLANILVSSNEIRDVKRGVKICTILKNKEYIEMDKVNTLIEVANCKIMKDTRNKLSQKIEDTSQESLENIKNKMEGK